MKKVLILSREDAIVTRTYQEIEELHKHFDQKTEFIKKQIQDLKEDANQKRKESWDRMIEHLKAEQLLPSDFSSEKYHFHFDEQGEVLYLCDGSDHPSPGPFPQGHPLNEIFKNAAPGSGVVFGPFSFD